MADNMLTCFEFRKNVTGRCTQEPAQIGQWTFPSVT